MASVFSHAIAAIAAGKIYFRHPASGRTILLGVLCSVIPDADVIGFWRGVPYESMFGHRGFTHSLFFAALLASMVMLLFYREKFLSRQYAVRWIYFFIATASHGVIDAMTTDGLGVAFFSPFDNERYFFPFRPILVSPISITKFFSGRGVEVLKSEFIWIWIPSLLLIAVSLIIRREKARRKD